MAGERIHVIEIGTGVVSIISGFILHWWSTQILWILIHPPPLAKQLIDCLPFVFWMIGALLIVDGVRRMIMRKGRWK